MHKTELIPGYTYGSESVPRSPISRHELELLKQSLLFTDEDQAALRVAGKVLDDQVDDILDVWYAFIGANPFLIRAFAGPNGKPIPEYLEAVRQRFGQWILDTCNRSYDQDWLNYQYEIALRHTRARKNLTDHVDSVPYVPLRYILTLQYAVSITMKPFLAQKGNSAEEVEDMYQAWIKAVTLQVTLWTQAYVTNGEF